MDGEPRSLRAEHLPSQSEDAPTTRDLLRLQVQLQQARRETAALGLALTRAETELARLYSLEQEFEVARFAYYNLDIVQRQLDDLRSSRSWRWTAPLRLRGHLQAWRLKLGDLRRALGYIRANEEAVRHLVPRLLEQLPRAVELMPLLIERLRR